ncbi:MAG: MarR family transcriptional regulator [Hyphomicrobiales bacterium]|nr:MarR family transcriptional regulator [Hyphomicrobiales bacterium]
MRLDNQLCFALYAATHAITRAYRPLLNDLDLTYPQFLVMLALWERDAQTVSALGATLQLDSGTLSPVLKRLEKSGYIAKARQKADERVVVVMLTESGRALRGDGERACLNVRVQTAMESQDVTALCVELHALNKELSQRNLEAHVDTARPLRRKSA